MKSLEWLYSLERFGTKLGLERMTRIMKLLGSQETTLKVVHVTGTNGKGSTSAMIANILQKAGYSVGLYTSPNLVRFNERIKINFEDISDKDLSLLIEKVRAVADKNKIQLTFFEFATAVAFLYFAEKKVNYAVIEVGIGGRLDATNIVNPLVSIITNVEIDHSHILGKNKLDIAKEKAGIIKKGVPLVTATKDEEIKGYLRNLCKRLGCEFLYVDDDTRGDIRKNYKINLLGEHQIDNAACALIACHFLGIDDKYVYEGLATVHWPGRIDIRKWKNCNVIIDSAHNPAGMGSFASFLKTNKVNERVFVIGFSADKDIDCMLRILSDVIKKNDRVYITKSDYKPADISYVRDKLAKLRPELKIEIFEEAKDAVVKAMECSDIVITGSIYLIGKILQDEDKFK